MTDTERENCRRLAKWLGWRIERRSFKHTPDLLWVLIQPDGDRATEYCYRSEDEAWDEIPNFYRSEEASAMLVEKMAMACEGLFSLRWSDSQQEWQVALRLAEIESHPDRKHAIVLAALALAGKSGIGSVRIAGLL